MKPKKARVGVPVTTWSGYAWEQPLDQHHVLYRLAGKIDWNVVEAHFWRTLFRGEALVLVYDPF